MAPRSAGDLASLDTRGAYAHAAGRPVHLGVDDLKVGVEAARGAAVRERDPVAEPRPLAADVADRSHGIAPEGDRGRMPPRRRPGQKSKEIRLSAPARTSPHTPPCRTPGDPTSS